MGEIHTHNISCCNRSNLHHQRDLHNPLIASHVHHVYHVCQDLGYKVGYNLFHLEGTVQLTSRFDAVCLIEFGGESESE